MERVGLAGLDNRDVASLSGGQEAAGCLGAQLGAESAPLDA